MLPAGHKFPLGKYTKLHDTLEQEFPGIFILGAPATTRDLLLVHDAGYVRAVTEGTLGTAAIRRLGFPWSESLVLRAQRSVGGTLAALSWAMQHGAGGHIAGGTHHAFVDHGEGFCVFNDLAVAAVRVAQRDYGVERVAIVDLDVHQGNGTAAIFAGDPRVFTLSLHGEKNYPFKKESSSLDLGLLTTATIRCILHISRWGCGPSSTFARSWCSSSRASTAWPATARPHVALAGGAGSPRCDGDGPGARAGVVVTTLGGGYGRDIGPTVQAHANVFRRLVRTFG